MNVELQSKHNFIYVYITYMFGLYRAIIKLYTEA